MLTTQFNQLMDRIGYSKDKVYHFIVPGCEQWTMQSGKIVDLNDIYMGYIHLTETGFSYDFYIDVESIAMVF